MNTFEAHLLMGQKYMKHNFVVPFISPAPYMLEFLFGLLVLTVIIYFNLEISRAYEELKNYVKPNSVQYKRSTCKFEGQFSSTTVSTSLIRCEHIKKRGRNRRTLSKMSWLTEDREEFAELFSGDYRLSADRARRRLFVDKLTALTPAQFVRLDKEEQMRQVQTDGCMRSLTTLFHNVSQKRYEGPELREQIDEAKEDCECSVVSHQMIKYLDSERVTESLINVINDIIDEATAENPLPVSGDLATLLYDIGNLKERTAHLVCIPDSSSSTTASEAGMIGT